jgi:SAM-dependent methyltransferase
MNPVPSRFLRLIHRVRYALYGRRQGLGRPIPPTALDHEYASGAWAHFFGPSERARHDELIRLIRAAHPRPRLLDLGCGSGRLASLLDPGSLAHYLGVDLSAEGLWQAAALRLAHGRFERRDFEQWTPAPGDFDVITFNECLGYAPDPLRTARRFYATLAPGGGLLVSHFRSGNHAEFWRRLGREFDFPVQLVVSNDAGQTWDLRQLVRRCPVFKCAVS